MIITKFKLYTSMVKNYTMIFPKVSPPCITLLLRSFSHGSLWLVLSLAYKVLGGLASAKLSSLDIPSTSPHPAG